MSIFTTAENDYFQAILAKNPNQRTDKDLLYLGNRIRQWAIFMVHNADSGHPGGPLGLADIYSALFFKIMQYDVKNYLNSNSDYLLLSNGHVCAVRYAAMAMAGFLPEDELKQFRQLGSRLQGHPSTKYFPELVNSSGSLGQGLAVAGGLALGLKNQEKNNRVYVCISDGECQEGMTWEAAMAIAHRKLNNITVFLDYNNIQIDGYVKDVMDVGSLADKFQSFGWHTITASGHDMKGILQAFEDAKKITDKPCIVVFNTILGKDVSFMENQPGWHGKPPNKEQYEKAIAELKIVANKLIA